ncbi:hypothetical protein [uncultured Winogradskyella sp.]|uniref:hypothetical protein n=1 Tax=uncultured Winogradskyella sp. TaxID=395353 RepID=UPI0026273CE3|nr:hypothetical protein [uncultured Winogradskyella sp.]
MEIEEIWIKQSHNNQLKTKNIFSKKSKSPLRLLKRNLKINCFSLIFTFVFFVCVAIIFPNKIIKSLSLLFCLYNIYELTKTINFYKDFASFEDILFTVNIKTHLEIHSKLIKQSIKSQEKKSLFFLPCSVILGLIIGSTILQNDIDPIIQMSFIIVAIISIFITTPLLYLVNKKINNQMYSIHLARMDVMINLLN